MMKRNFVLLAIAALLVVAPARGETPTIETVKSTMDDAWKKVDSFTSDVTMSFLMPLGHEPIPLTGGGELNYLRENGKEKYRQLIVTKVPEPFNMEMKVDVLLDDNTVYTTTEIMGQKQTHKGEPSLEQSALPPGGSRLIETMQEQMTIEVQPNQTLDGNEVFVLQGKAKNPEMPFSKALFYIDQELGIQRKTEIYQQDGEVGITVLFENVRLNTNPDSSLFTPPE